MYIVYQKQKLWLALPVHMDLDVISLRVYSKVDTNSTDFYTMTWVKC